MLIEGVVGPRGIALGDGAQIQPRLTRDGSVAVSDSHGHFNEAVQRGNVYTSITPVAGVAIPAVAAYAAAVAAAVQNPKTSGIGMSILKVVFGLQSTGTVAPGVMEYVAQTNPAAALVTGTAIAPVNALIGGSLGKGLAFVTSTFPAAPVGVRPAFSATSYATTATGQHFQLVDVVDGEIVLLPGTALGVQIIGAAAAGSVWQVGFVWEEIPLLTPAS